MQECNQAALKKNFYFHEKHDSNEAPGIVLEIQNDSTPYVQGISV
jgi:hypothetical protein